MVLESVVKLDTVSIKYGFGAAREVCIYALPTGLDPATS